MRKRKVTRKGIKFQTGEPLSYGSTWKVPRLQERVPRSFPRPLMPARKAGMSRLAWSLLHASSKRRLPLQVRRQPLARPTLSTGSRNVRFRFSSPFARQYAQLRAIGSMVRLPEKVSFCVKRKVRRAVLFAFRRAGYSGSGPGRRRSYRRNSDSLHGC